MRDRCHWEHVQLFIAIQSVVERLELGGRSSLRQEDYRRRESFETGRSAIQARFDSSLACAILEFSKSELDGEDSDVAAGSIGQRTEVSRRTTPVASERGGRAALAGTIFGRMGQRIFSRVGPHGPRS